MTTPVAPIFAFRSSQPRPWYCPGGGSVGNSNMARPFPSLVSSAGMTGVFGPTVLDMGGVYGTTPMVGVLFNGLGNLNFLDNDGNGEFCVLSRIVPKWTGAPSNALGVCAGGQSLFMCGVNNSAAVSYFELYLFSNGQFGVMFVGGDQGTILLQATSTGAYTGYQAGKAVDILWSWDGSRGPTAMKVSVEGVLVATFDTTVMGGSNTFQNNWYNSQVAQFCIGANYGYSDNASFCAYRLNEFLAFNTALPSTYTPRTDFWPCQSFDPLLNTYSKGIYPL